MKKKKERKIEPNFEAMKINNLKQMYGPKWKEIYNKQHPKKRLFRPNFISR